MRITIKNEETPEEIVAVLNWVLIFIDEASEITADMSMALLRLSGFFFLSQKLQIALYVDKGEV
jgi:hypothetical protein